jgi:hypothetical protein
MIDLAEECLSIISGDVFHVTETGPLRVPVHRFTLRRDEKLKLVLETETDGEARSMAAQPVAGTIYFSTDRVALEGIAGARAELSGVVTSSFRTSMGPSRRTTSSETAGVHRATVTLGTPDSEVSFTIDWLENFPQSSFHWPDSIETVTEEKITRSFSPPENDFVMVTREKGNSFSRTAVKLVVQGWTMYVCALDRRKAAGGIDPGCIIFEGKPSNEFRRSIHVALSFAFGAYLVELGTSFYGREWNLVEATAVSAYSLRGRVFDMAPLQLAPLGSRFEKSIDRAMLNRFVAGIVAKYEELDLGNVSWAYWHACAATIHVAPANFGAAIEALQRAYIRANPDTVSTTILSGPVWKSLRRSLADAIDEADVAEGIGQALKAKLVTLNKLPQRQLLRSVLEANGLQLGQEEDAAWKRRNEAAHGMPVLPGEEAAAITDMRLLQTLFHRMLLRMIDAADIYVDYSSLGHVCRRLDTPSAGDLSVATRGQGATTES